MNAHHSKVVHHKKIKKKLKTKSKKKEDDDLVKGNLFPIHFVDDTKAAFNLLDLMIGTPVMMVDRANFVQHIFEFVELDVSYKELYNRLETADVDELMILWDPMQKYGASYNVIINQDKMISLKKVKVKVFIKFYGLEIKTKLKEDEVVEDSASKLDASMNNNFTKWISLGSSLDVDAMVISETRKPAEVESSVASSQAGYVPKRNATTQTCYQVLTEEEVEMHLRHPDLPRFLQKVLPEFEKILIENAQWDIFKDDWNTKDGDNNKT